ncbi:ADP-ribosylhydrolase ARH3-like isoform X2 [Dermacentor andersoni]|uniref:ADP-ribosylhydrolase ARH3-like isoform X2 n=1 Tax=Dermacentor andersoni TaxID=34620 RepID=UPI0021551E80|nr:ADP-ribosylhydrolase ARH3-like isoform X2 [Dermacentor andersoni]
MASNCEGNTGIGRRTRERTRSDRQETESSYGPAVHGNSPVSHSSLAENELRWLGGRHEALAAASENMSTPQANASDGFGKAEAPCQQTVLESSPLSHTSPFEIELRKPGRARSDRWKREMPNMKALSVGSSPLSPTCLVENELLDVSLGLKAKYQGCMVGALIGDCLGSPFEEIPFRDVLPTSQLPRFLWRIRRKLVKADDMAGRRFTVDPDHEFGGYYKFTDDTAMTHTLAESLLDCGGFDPTVVARRFTEDFYQNGEVKHEYGPKVKRVFAALAKEKYEDVYGPAKEQFDGTGSYGNGAAMRVAPVSLYYYGDEKRAVQVAQNQGKLTHAHQLGYNAAALVCLAVQLALSLDPSKKLDVGRFLDTLKLKMEKIEPKQCRFYTEKLVIIKKMLNGYEDAPPERVAAILGNEMTADRSVPAALYAFLRGTRPLTGCKTSNGFIRALFFAISMGGDADTIGTMTGSIAGAYYGIFKVPRTMQRYCQGEQKATCLGNRLLTERRQPK